MEDKRKQLRKKQIIEERWILKSSLFFSFIFLNVEIIH